MRLEYPEKVNYYFLFEHVFLDLPNPQPNPHAPYKQIKNTASMTQQKYVAPTLHGGEWGCFYNNFKAPLFFFSTSNPKPPPLK